MTSDSDMTAILGRIRLIQERLGISERHLAIQAGLSPDAIRNWRRRMLNEDGDVGAHKHSLASLAKFSGVSQQWLETGLEDIGVEDHQIVRTPTPSVMSGLRRIACYDIEAEAGSGAVVTIEQAMFEIGFSPEMLRNITNAANEQLALIRVRGESMLPTLVDGDWMLVDTTKRNINYDGLFILRYLDVLRVKRLDRNPSNGRYLVKSDNHNYETFEVDGSDLDVVGRVVWIGRRI